MAKPTEEGCISSLKYAIATPGKPLNAMPSKVRIPRNDAQPGASGDSAVSAAEANIDAAITGLRPQASDTDPASKIATATAAVTDEMAKLLAAALI
jgi:hypothetical protein